MKLNTVQHTYICALTELAQCGLLSNGGYRVGLGGRDDRLPAIFRKELMSEELQREHSEVRHVCYGPDL